MTFEPQADVAKKNPIDPLGGATISPHQSQMLSAWTDDHLTRRQLEWIHAEHEMLCSLIRTNDLIVDVGCGNARVLNQIGKIPFAAYVGIDSDRASIELAKSTFSDHRYTFLTDDALQALPRLSLSAPDLVSQPARRVVVCIGNTVGTFDDNRAVALRAMAEAADFVIVSVCKNSPEVILQRLEYYAKNGLSCRVEDWSSGSIWSEMWGESRSFDDKALRALVGEAKVEGLGFCVSTQLVGEMGIALLLERNPSH